MNINSLMSSTYTASSASSSGLSGLASGIDTEQMVQAMLANTQAKIDKQSGLKQQILWKQAIYRDIISSINTFQSKYFSSTSSTNLMSTVFFNAMKATTASQAFRVTATSSASASSVKLEVKQLATNTKQISSDAVSGKLAGELNATAIQSAIDAQLAADYKVKFEVDGTAVEVDVKDIFVGGGTFTNLTKEQKLDAVTARINDAFAAAGQSGITATRDGSALKITNSDSSKVVSVSSDSTAEGLKVLGLTAGRNSSNGTISSTMNVQNELTLDVSLDEVKKAVSIDLSKVVTGAGTFDANMFGTELQAQLNKLHGNGQITVLQSGNTFELATSAGRKVMVGGDASTLSMLGMKNGQSNKIGLGGTLGDLYFANGLQGSKYTFAINGETFSFTKDATMSEVLSKINSSSAGVKITYKSVEDKFVIETTNSGAGFGITMSQSEGNLLSAMFGYGAEETGGSVSSNILGKTSIASNGALTAGVFDIASGKFNINVNGTNHSITMAAKSDGTNYTQAEAITHINSELDKLFGTGSINIDAGTGALKVNNGAIVKFAQTGDLSDPAASEQKALDGDLALAFGFSMVATDNLADAGTSLADIGFTGGLGSFGPGTTLGALSGDLAFVDGRIVMSGMGAGLSAADTKTLFGQDSITLGVRQGTVTSMADLKKDGVNAIVEIDGVETERASNSFTVNGLNIELIAETTTAETIEITRGSDQIVDAVKSFINDYNTLIDKLNSLIREESTYKTYAPLTEAQKKEMSDREIELWEEKAQQGLMRNDSAISTLLQQMRSALFTTSGSSSLTLYNLGIETSSNWQDYGKLVMTEDGEAMLRKQLESNSDEVVKLFTDPTSGLSTKLNNILKSAANTSSGSPGSLVQIAGVANRASETNNELYLRLANIEQRITSLKALYEREKTRYWNKFNAMEQMISNMNSQSSWLSMQMNG